MRWDEMKRMEDHFDHAFEKFKADPKAWETCRSGEVMALILHEQGIQYGIFSDAAEAEKHFFKPLREAGEWADQRFNTIWKRFDWATADRIREKYPVMPCGVISHAKHS